MWESIVQLTEIGLNSYVIVVISSYVLLMIISRIQLSRYRSKTEDYDGDILLNSQLTPTIALIAPAYNEGATIIDNVKSMLSLRYKKLEIIIVNDGSKDDSLQRLIEAFDLRSSNQRPIGHLACAEIRSIYRSTQQSLSHLVVVDKMNGGKADALNAGLNIAKSQLVACIDVDCILSRDALLKMVKPFVEDESTIAVGGVIRAANGTVIEEGHLKAVKLGNNLLSIFQHLEYARAFLVGRMAWSKLNGLILISGAFGLFRKDLAIACGGYDHDSIGEDMELVVRMRRYKIEHDQKFRVDYIPEPLCWTEVPETIQVLGKQRNRWTRGSIDTLLKHRKLFFNPRYGTMGMLSFPYWVFFEWFAPLIEVFALGGAAFLWFQGQLDFNEIMKLILAIYCFAIWSNSVSISFEYHYTTQLLSKKDQLKLVLVSLIEPIFNHAFNVYWAIRGNIDYLKGDKSWGNMARKGFSAPQS